MSNMPLRGEIEIHKYEAEWDESQQKWVSKELVDKIVQSNQIGYRWVAERRTSGGGTFDAGATSIRLAQTRSRGRGVQPNDIYISYTQNLVAGAWVARNPTNIYLPAITLAYRWWRATFDPPVSGSRYISTIMLPEAVAATFDQTAGTTLNEICEQTDSQILDVFYRVYIDDEKVSSATSGEISKRAAWYQNANAYTSGGSSFRGATRYYGFDCGFDWWPKGIEGYSNNFAAASWTNWDPITSGYALRLLDGMKYVDMNMVSTDFVGQFLGSVAYKNTSLSSSTATYYSTKVSSADVVPEGTSVMQSIFPKLKSSTAPFLDIGNPAAGTGTVAVTETVPGSSWSPTDHNFAEVYRLLVTTTGDAGVAEYKLLKQICTPLATNVWSSRWQLPVPSLPTWDSSANMGRSFASLPETDADSLRHGVHGPITSTAVDTGFNVEGAPFLLRYRWPEYMSAGEGYGDQFDDTLEDVHGITIYNLKGDDPLNLNSSTTPALGVSDIRQIAVEEDTGTIWVACSDTGLWQITRANNDLSTGISTISAITRITTTAGIADDTKCRGVVLEKTNGIANSSSNLWALFDVEMCVSTDGGATWTVYNEISSPAFILTGVTGTGGLAPDRIMHFEKDHHQATKDRFFLAVRANASTSDGRGFWWSTDAVDTVGGVGTAVDVDANTTITNPDICTRKLIGTKSIYAGKDENWYFRIYTGQTGIIRFAFNATTDTGETNNTSISTCVGQGINVYFDDAGDDWIIGYDNTGSNIERVKGRRPADVTSTGSPYKVIAWRINSSTTTSYQDYMAGTTVNVGKGVWIGCNGWSEHTQQQPQGCRQMYQRFYDSSEGGMDSSGNVTQTEIWEEYGWAGGTGPWTLGDSTSKPVHITNDPLIDGLSIQFTDDSGTPGTSFQDTDMYDAWAFKGVIKDNATIVDYTGYTAGLPLVSGTDFVGYDGTTAATTVPATTGGLVTNELLCFAWTESTFDFFNAEPGFIGWMSSTANQYQCQFDAVLSGDFSLEFKMNLGHHTTSDFTRIGLMPVANSGVVTNNFTNGFITLDATSFNETNNTRVIRVGNGTTDTSNLASVNHVFQKTNPTADDYFVKDNLDLFRIQRTSGNITYDYKRNGEGSWTNIYGSGGELDTVNDLILHATMDGTDTQVFYDMHLTYTDNRQYVFVGNGTTTGPGNLQDAGGVTDNFPDPNFRGVARSSSPNFVVEVDTTGSGNWENRIIRTDTTASGTPPNYAPGTDSVLLTYGGKLVFNAADANRPFRGNWIYTQTLNLK